MTSEESLVIVATDLSYEAHLLARLDHTNIIRLQGVAAEGLAQAFCCGKGYFLLLDILEETLMDRLHRWRQEQDAEQCYNKKWPSPVNNFLYYCKSMGRRRRRRRTISSATMMRQLEQQPSRVLSTTFEERLRTVAFGIAEGMKYLHAQGIVLRDLKPDNIGFDATGTVKLFDLGLARPIEDCCSSSLAGSFRYMAPETMMCRPSGFQSDVYSFGVVLWELSTLQRPYNDWFCGLKGGGGKPSFLSRRRRRRRRRANNNNNNNKSFSETVVLGGWRHSVGDIPCKVTRRLIQDCWDPNPDARPSFSRIWLLLKDVCDQPDHMGFSSQRLQLLKTTITKEVVPSSSSSSPAAVGGLVQRGMRSTRKFLRAFKKKDTTTSSPFEASSSTLFLQ
jgi:serine/threonine protein kinase